MTMPKEELDSVNIQFQIGEPEKVNNFKYRGAWISNNNDLNEEIKCKIE